MAAVVFYLKPLGCITFHPPTDQTLILRGGTRGVELGREEAIPN